MLSHPKRKAVTLHTLLIILSIMTLVPFFFTVNSIFRTSREIDQSFFQFPMAFRGVAESVWAMASGQEEIPVEDEYGNLQEMKPGAALSHYVELTQKGPEVAWGALRPYMINSFVVSILSALGVCIIGSSTAYILARYKFMGSHVVFMMILATMMFPGVLLLVPTYLLVKDLGLLNTYWAMILPYIATGQVVAIFVFRSFFSGLPEDLFESARIDGAGHFGIYANIILPLSKPVFSVVIIMNVLGTWNNFLWPFITNSEGKYHVIASGLYVMARSSDAQNFSMMFAAYAIGALPLLVLFIYATKPFMRGITSGALKA